MFHISKERALKLLELNSIYSEKQLKKQYYKKALLYHPDKNPYNEELFKHINEAYQLLHSELNNTLNDTYKSISKDETNIFEYSSLLKQFISSYFNDYNVEDSSLFNYIYSIVNTYSEKNKNDMIEIIKNKLNEYDMKNVKENMGIVKDILQFLKNNSYLFETNKSHLKLNKHMKENIVIQPTLFDIYNQKVYVYEIHNSLGNIYTTLDTHIYIPTWLDEVEIQKKCISTSYEDIPIYRHFVINVQPQLPSNVTIDEDNNIHIYKHFDLFQLLKKEYIEIQELIQEQYQTSILKIYIQDLYIRKYQTFIFEKKGIPIINDIHICDNSNISNVIIHIYIDTV